MANIKSNIIKTSRCEFVDIFWARRVHFSSAVCIDLPLTVIKTENKHFLQELYDSYCALRGRNDAELFRHSLQYRGTKKLQSAKLSNLKSESPRVYSRFWMSNLYSTVVTQSEPFLFFDHSDNYFKSSISCSSPVYDLVTVQWNSHFFLLELLERSSNLLEISLHYSLPPHDPLWALSEMDQCEKHKSERILPASR